MLLGSDSSSTKQHASRNKQKRKNKLKAAKLAAYHTPYPIQGRNWRRMRA